MRSLPSFLLALAILSLVSCDSSDFRGTLGVGEQSSSESAAKDKQAKKKTQDAIPELPIDVEPNPEESGEPSPSASPSPSSSPQPMPEPAEPHLRGHHTMVWTGSLALVWGGVGCQASGANCLNFEYLNTGLRIDPANKTVTPTKVDPEITGRYGHSAVWTGSRMIVYGGNSPSGNNASYDPVSDTWQKIDYSSGPTNRSWHSSIWTGSLMYMWGGSLQEYGQNWYGGIYNPANDQWTKISSANAPASGVFQTSVWTGTKLIAWGGRNGDGTIRYDDGGIYDPATDQWTKISTVNAPLPRANHCAVWTGSKMLVWGGVPADTMKTFQDVGGIYDPANDSWEKIPTAGAHDAGIYSTCNWTGSELIVFAGSDPTATGNDIYKNTVSLFNPTTMQWRRFTAPPELKPRANHAAVWTGTHLIIYGGFWLNCSVHANDAWMFELATGTWTKIK